jgi:hypothetical protein
VDRQRARQSAGKKQGYSGKHRAKSYATVQVSVIEIWMTTIAKID